MIFKCCWVMSVLIATSTLSTLATAENVYKCGNTYSQSPCPGAKLLNIDDSRDPQQKKLKDEVTRRDAELANDMEKTRLANEAALAAQRTPPAPSDGKPQRVKVVTAEPTLVYARKPRLNRPHKPKAFTATVPDTVDKPVKPGKPRTHRPEGAR